MPTSVTEAPGKRWTRAECQAMEASGAWDQRRLELVEGELIDKSGKKRPHVNAQHRIFTWLISVFEWCYVNAAAPIDVAAKDNGVNEPEPDLIVLARPFMEFEAGNPQPGDLRLVVEISDSTLGFDLTTKAALYARAEIVEYWVVDVPAHRLVVHRNPSAGRYQSIEVFNEDESVSPLAAPGNQFLVADAFPR